MDFQPIIVILALVGIYLGLCDLLDYAVRHVLLGRKGAHRE